MKPPKCSTSCKQESDSEMDEVQVFANGISSTSTVTSATFPSVPATMSPLPSRIRRKNSGCAAKGSKSATINVSNVQNSPHMVLDVTVVSGDKEPLSQSDGQETNDYKMPIMENEVQEDGNEIEKEGVYMKRNRLKPENVEKNCTKCQENDRKLQNMEAKQAKTKEKKRVLEGKCNDLQNQLDDALKLVNFGFANNSYSTESYRQNLEAMSSCIDRLTKQNEDLTCDLFVAGRRFEKEFEAYEKRLLRETECEKNVMQERIKSLENQVSEMNEQNHDREERFSVEKEELVEKTQIATVNHYKAEFEAYEQQLLRETECEKNVMRERIKSLENQVSELSEQLEAYEEQRLRETECEKNVMQDRIKSLENQVSELNEQHQRALESSARRCRNQRRIIDDLTNKNYELEEDIGNINNQLNAQRERSDANDVFLNDLLTAFDRRLETFEGREEGYYRLYEEVRQMLDRLRVPRQLPNEQYIDDLRLPQQPGFQLSSDIAVLHCEIVSGVHVPD